MLTQIEPSSKNKKTKPKTWKIKKKKKTQAQKKKRKNKQTRDKSFKPDLISKTYNFVKFWIQVQLKNLTVNKYIFEIWNQRKILIKKNLQKKKNSNKTNEDKTWHKKTNED